MGFFFCHCCLEGQRKLRVIIQGEDRFALKKDTDRRIALGKVSHDSDEVHHITGKARNALGDNHIDFAMLGIGNHLEELLTLIEGCTGNAFIGIDVYQRPMGVLHHEIFVIPFLKLKGGRLTDIIRGDADINGNPLGDVIVIVAGLLGFRYVVIIVRVDLNMDALSLLCFGSFLFEPSAFVNHSIISSQTHHRGGKSSPLERSRCPSCPLCSRTQV